MSGAPVAENAPAAAAAPAAAPAAAAGSTAAAPNEMAPTGVKAAAGQTLIDIAAPLDSLKKDLTLSAEKDKLENLLAEYPHVRRLAEDGNSFYRGYLFGLLDWISSTMRHEKVSDEKKEEVNHVIDMIADSIEYVPSNIERKELAKDLPLYHKSLCTMMTNVRDTKPHGKDIAQMLATNKDEGVQYLRCLASAYLARHDSCLQYIPDWIAPATYRREFVEPLQGGHDGGWAQPILLGLATGAGVRIVSLLQDGDKNKDRVCPSSAVPRIFLLASKFEKAPEAPKEAQKGSRLEVEKTRQAEECSKDGAIGHAAHSTVNLASSLGASAKKAVSSHSTMRPIHYDWVEYTPAARSCLVPGTGVQCVVQ